MQPAAFDSVWLEVHLLGIMGTRLRPSGNGGAWEQSVTRSGNRDRLREIVGFVATSLLGLLLFLSTAAELRADAREALQKAVVLVQQGRLVEADQQAQLALSNPQTRAVAYSVLGTIRFQQNRLPESVDFFQKAIRLDPRLLGAHLSLAEVYTIQGKPELALGLYQRSEERRV